MTLEVTVENYLKKETIKAGGLCFKFTSYVRGVPDRIVILDKRVYFVETKRPTGGRVSEMQKFWKRKIESQGVPHLIIHTKAEVDAFIEGVKDGKL